MSLLSNLKNKVGTLTQKQPEQNHPTPENTPYQMLGGEEGVRKLANDFYDIMTEDERASELLAIHPQPMCSIRQRFYEYLSGWLGGPPLFEQKYGHPRLRARHLPFQIDESMRDQWIHCMDKALDINVKNDQLKQGLKTSFYNLATHMINQ